MTTGQIIFMAALGALALWFLWPRQRKLTPGWQARSRLYSHTARATLEGRRIINEAISLSYDHPSLSPTELIRLAYWGASGPVDHEWRHQIESDQ